MSLLKEALASEALCPVFLRGIGGASVETLLRTNPQMATWLEPIARTPDYTTSCYDAYTAPLCDYEVNEHYVPSSACQTALGAFTQLLTACIQHNPGATCASFDGTNIVDPADFCANSILQDADSAPIRVESLADCVAFVANFNACADAGIPVLKMESCHSPMWDAHCRIQLQSAGSSVAEDQVCENLVAPALLLSPALPPVAINDTEAYCGQLYGEYAARLTKRHGDALIKVQAAYDTLASCKTLREYCIENHLRPTQEVVKSMKATLDKLRGGVEAIQNVNANSYAQVRDPLGYDPALIYIRAEDASELDDYLLKIDHLRDQVTSRFDSDVSIESDRWGRPNLVAVRSQIESWRGHSKDNTFGLIAEPLLQIASDAQQRWAVEYPKSLSPETSDSFPMTDPIFQKVAESQTVYVNDVLANKTIARGYDSKVFDAAKTSINAMTAAVESIYPVVCGVCLDLQKRYCAADEYTLKTGLTFAAIRLLFKTQLQMMAGT